MFSPDGLSPGHEAMASASSQFHKMQYSYHIYYYIVHMYHQRIKTFHASYTQTYIKDWKVNINDERDLFELARAR